MTGDGAAEGTATRAAGRGRRRAAAWRHVARAGLAVVLAAVVAAPATATVAAPAAAPPLPPSPADRFGPLYAAVELARVFPDSKTFADAVPRRDPVAIATDYARERPAGAALAAFVAANFDLPAAAAAGAPPVPPGLPLGRHIAALWPVLTRQPAPAPPGGSLLALPAPYVVPGGRFREVYYWDSYFTMLGLVRDGQAALVDGMVDDFTSLIERYGHIPNGTRSYYLGRSQPPFFYAMLALAPGADAATRARRLAALRREYAYWMDGAAALAPDAAARRIVRLPDGALLNRWWDGRDTPRDEAYREDVATAAAAAPRPAAEVYRDLRAAAESGWDFSSRWLGDGRTLATVRTTAIVPADLNALLYGVERAIAAGCGESGDQACAAEATAAADHRRAAMTRWLWDGRCGCFGDYDRRRRRPTGVVSAASVVPLFTGVATRAQAATTAAVVRRSLLAPGGLRTTLSATGQQWDAPNGWAPLQWLAVAGLDRYGETALADDIATRWLATVGREYAASGRLLEKYDVEAAVPGGGGEYPTQDGFGWTNGVTQALLARQLTNR